VRPGEGHVLLQSLPSAGERRTTAEMKGPVHTSLRSCFEQYSSHLSDEITLLEWMGFFTLLLKTISVGVSGFPHTRPLAVLLHIPVGRTPWE